MRSTVLPPRTLPTVHLQDVIEFNVEADMVRQGSGLPLLARAHLEWTTA
jgi:hypothetical protein